MNLVLGFGPNLGLALWPRAKPINNQSVDFGAIDILVLFCCVGKFFYSAVQRFTIYDDI